MSQPDALAFRYSHLFRCTNSELWTSRQQLWRINADSSSTGPAIPASTWRSFQPLASPLLSAPLPGPSWSLMAPNRSPQLHLDQSAQNCLELLSQCKSYHFLPTAPFSFKNSPMSLTWPALQGMHGSAHAPEAACPLQHSLPSSLLLLQGLGSIPPAWSVHPTGSVLHASLPWTLPD